MCNPLIIRVAGNVGQQGEKNMPLHDWKDESGLDGFHLLWISHLFHVIKPQLPEGFRAYVGPVPALEVAASERPDVAVRHWLPEPPADAAPGGNGSAHAAADEPDFETATIVLDPQRALYVTYRGRLVAAVELISPRNKDRPSARDHYLARYLGYLREGANLLLVDVHRRPLDFSFADALAMELHIEQPPTPTPLAVAYRVGEPAAEGGRLLAIWRRPLKVGAPLPTMLLPLTVRGSIDVNLEETYMRAAADAYMA
jgi:hypothetical protein